MIDTLPAAAVLPALLDALESAGLGCTIVVDRGDRLERAFANDALARIMGIDLETLRALPPLDIAPPDERERLTQLRESIGTAGAGPRIVQTVIRRPDGVSVPIEVALGYAIMEGARATFAFTRDVSERTAMETALRESEERFRLVSDASPDSIVVFAKGKYLYANPVALRHLRIASLDDLAKAVPWGRVAPDRRPAIAEIVERVRAGEKLPPHEVRITSADGKERILECSVSCVPLGGDQAVVAYTRDITERLLLQAEVMKQDRMASVGMLAAGVAHELNNPLMALGMQARRLREDADKHALPAEVRESLAEMEDAATRMNAIIADLLFMARPVEQPQAHVDVAQIMRSTVALLRAGTPECPVIAVEVEALPPIQGYASKLGQIFFNVLRNAVQAVEGAAGGKIDVRARAADDAIVIEVADNGRGIPSEVLPRVTQPFFTTKPQGTGLGLWISQALVSLHGGSLDLRSVEGAGTTVTLRFPERLATAT